MSLNYYYILMSQKEMFENQVLEESLRERAAYYLAKNKNLDFWIVLNPNFSNENNFKEKIKKTNFYIQQSKKIFDQTNTSYYAALITSNKEFINWLQLRLGYFEDIQKQELGNKEFISDGLFGIINNSGNESVLLNKKNYLYPSLYKERYAKIIEKYYK